MAWFSAYFHQMSGKGSKQSALTGAGSGESARSNSVVHPVGRIGKLLPCAFRVPAGRVQVFVARGSGPGRPRSLPLSARNWWAIVCRNRCGCNFTPMMAEYLSHIGPDATIREWASFPDKDLLALYRRANFQLRLQCPSGCNRQRD